MTREEYVAKLEELIARHQRVQQTNPPASRAWQAASDEIKRLAKLITVTKNAASRGARW